MGQKLTIFNTKCSFFSSKMLNMLILLHNITNKSIYSTYFVFKNTWDNIWVENFLKNFCQKNFQKIFEKNFYKKIFWPKNFHKFENFDQFLVNFYKKWRNMDEIWKIWTESQNMEKYGKYGLITHYRSYQHMLKLCFLDVSEPN